MDGQRSMHTISMKFLSWMQQQSARRHMYPKIIKNELQNLFFMVEGFIYNYKSQSKGLIFVLAAEIFHFVPPAADAPLYDLFHPIYKVTRVAQNHDCKIAVINDCINHV